MTGTRALITGITGQDGLYLAELLLAKGYEVYGLIRGPEQPQARAGRADVPDVELHTGDLTDLSSLIRALRDAQPGRGLQPRRRSPSSPTPGRTPS